MKNLLCIIFICLLCLTNNFAQQNKVFDKIRESLVFLQNKQFDEAETLLRQLQITAPNNVDVHNLLGIVFDQEGKTAEAEKQFRQAHQVDPKAVSPLVNLGVLLAKTARQSEAIKAFETVINLAPNHPEATINLGLLYNFIGDYPKAVEFLRKADSLQPNSYDIIFNLGTALYNIKAYNEAARKFEIAADLSPESAEPVYWLGIMAFSLDQDDLAKNYYKKALILRPDYAEANFMLGELFTKHQQYAEAKNYYELVVQADTTKPVNYIRLGGVYLFLKDFENALKTFKKAADLFPNVSEIHYFFAVTARGSGNNDLALDEVKKSLAIKETADSESLLGAIKADRDEPIEAENFLRKALLLNPKHLNSLNDLGRLLVKNRRFEESVSILQRAAALSKNPDIHYQLFIAFTRLKLSADAARELTVFKQFSEKH